MRSTPVLVAAIISLLSALNNTAALPTGTYDGQSPFRQFISFYFSYTTKPPENSKNTTKTTEVPSRNDYHYNYEYNQESMGPTLALVNTTCSWNLKQKFAKECDMYTTNLFCHPASHTCSCFSWKSMKAHNVTSEIFYEDDEEIKNYLTNLGDFLAIEMEWNEDIGKCQSLSGSACSVPDKFSDQFHDIFYVSCYPGLTCMEVKDEGFYIGRCMQRSAEQQYVHEEQKPEQVLEEAKEKIENQMDKIIVEEAFPNYENISGIE